MVPASPDRSPRNLRRHCGWHLARVVTLVGGLSLLGFTFVADQNIKSFDSVALRRPITSMEDFRSSSRTSRDDTSRIISSTPVHASNQRAQSEEEEEGPWPRVAWLMSFPNSGTSYSGQLVKHLTQTRMASNYGEQNLNHDGNSVSIFGDEDWNGPFFVDPTHTTGYYNPTKYVLTKTHCGGYRTNSSPDLYVESTHSFRRKCLGTKYTLNGTTFKGEYSSDLVSRAIHLVRNPFDNVVSRFNFEQKRQDPHASVQIPKSQEGFREFCRLMDRAWLESERTSIVYDETILSLAETIPCHSDFFRYIEWHNLAHVTTNDLQLRTLILHYEDYDTNFNQTAMRLLNFLELQETGIVKTFVSGKEYSQDYYTKEERAAAKRLVQLLALQTTWKTLKHYFK